MLFGLHAEGSRSSQNTTPPGVYGTTFSNQIQWINSNFVRFETYIVYVV